MNRLVCADVFNQDVRASWWSSCCSNSENRTVRIWDTNSPLGWNLVYFFPLCFSSSLQHLKVTIWCESQSAALLWILTSGARHAQLVILKSPSKKRRKWCVRVVKQEGSQLVWHDFRGQERAGELNVLNTARHFWSRPRDNSPACTWCQLRHSLWNCKHESVLHYNRAGTGPKMSQPSRNNGAFWNGTKWKRHSIANVYTVYKA